MSTCPIDLPVLTTEDDRRRAERLRIGSMLPIRIGRGEGILLDLSLGGAKLRHSVAVKRGGRSRLTMHWDHQVVSLTAEVLSSRLIDVGTAIRPAFYETRVQFVAMSHSEIEELATLMSMLRTRDLRILVANLQGWEDQPRQSLVSINASYIRCTRDGNSWLRKRTTNPHQPPDGFVLPATTEEKDIALLCRTWEQLDVDGRQLLQRMAAAAVDDITPISN